MNPHANAVLQPTLQAIQQRWGAQALRRASQPPPEAAFIATGFPGLDAVLGGGFPRGRLSELSGQPTSGMTTLALRTAAQAQLEGDGVVYFDLAATFDPEYAAACQINLADWLLVRPQTAEEALDLLFDVTTSGLPGLVIFNAVSGLTPHQQRLLPSTLERLHPALVHSRCALLVLARPTLAERVNSPLAAVRLRVAWEAWLHDGQDVTGCQAQMTVLKGRMASPEQSIHLQIAFPEAEAVP